MKTPGSARLPPEFALAALAAAAVLALSGAHAANAAPAVDTSQWKCETCPFEKAGSSGTVHAGAGLVSRDAAKFGDYTGLDKKGPYFIIDGELRHRDEDGLASRAQVADFGLDSLALGLEVWREGLFDLRLGLSQVPRRLSDSARTPFLDVGGDRLTLPAGFPAGNTAAMPLATTLAPVALGYDRLRSEISLAWQVAPRWTTQLSYRNDARTGTQRLAGSFFANSSELVAPLDQMTNRFEASAAYQAGAWQLSLAYHASLFRNGNQALTWSNPFAPVVAGATTGQMALAPSNQFHQLVASGGWDITPRIRASGEVAFGRMTQDESFVAATLNPNLVLAALPAASLGGVVDTFNAAARVSMALDGGVRLHASYGRDERDNGTPSGAYPAVSTDMFVGAAPRFNQPFSFTRDLFKIGGNARVGWARLSAGAEHDVRSRTLQEVVTTDETTVWARVAVRPLDGLGLSLKLSHGERSADDYGVATWISPPENPLLRKFNLAERQRSQGHLRADYAFADNVSVGFNAALARDRYEGSTIGLTDGRSQSLGADVSVAISDETQVHVFGQSERMRSNQAGSQLFAAADWWGEHRDQIDLLGVGVKQQVLDGALELGADLTFSRLKSRVRVDTGVAGGEFPEATNNLDSVRLQASYRLSKEVSLSGSYWVERMKSQDWRLDGVAPDTVANLLALGESAPRYRVHVLRLGLRYRF